MLIWIIKQLRQNVLINSRKWLKIRIIWIGKRNVGLIVKKQQLWWVVELLLLGFGFFRSVMTTLNSANFLFLLGFIFKYQTLSITVAFVDMLDDFYPKFTETQQRQNS